MSFVTVKEGQLKVQLINPDGECMYAAIGHQLHHTGIYSTFNFGVVNGPGHRKFAQYLRNQAAIYLDTHRDQFQNSLIGIMLEDPYHFSKYIVNGEVVNPQEAFEQVVKSVRTPVQNGGVWGNDSTLSALCSVFNVSIRVFYEKEENTSGLDSRIFEPFDGHSIGILQVVYRIGFSVDGKVGGVSRNHYDSVLECISISSISKIESVNAGRVDEELIDSLSCYDSDFSEVESTDVDDCDNSLSDSDIVSTVIEGINEKQHREADNVDTSVAKKLKHNEKFVSLDKKKVDSKKEKENLRRRLIYQKLSTEEKRNKRKRKMLLKYAKKKEEPLEEVLALKREKNRRRREMRKLKRDKEIESRRELIEKSKEEKRKLKNLKRKEKRLKKRLALKEVQEQLMPVENIKKDKEEISINIETEKLKSDEFIDVPDEEFICETVDGNGGNTTDCISLSSDELSCEGCQYTKENTECVLLPNDPTIIEKVCKEVNQVLNGVCGGRCYVCNRLVNSRCVRNFTEKYINGTDEAKKFVDDLVIVSGKYEMCGTCYRYVCNEKIPPLAVVNGFKYLPVPSYLDRLTEVEEHILALRLPFQQIVHLGKLGKLGQYGCKGSVINVPTDTSDVVHKIIPLLPEDDQLCIVNIKRKLIHKRAYARNFVDKTKITTWAKFLVNSSLYKEYGVIFDEKRLRGFDGEDAEPCMNEFGNKVFTVSDDPETEAEMFERLGNIQHTLLAEDRFSNVVCVVNPETDEINVAPGQNQSPLSVVWDRKAEELSFPSIYLGEPRPFKHYVTRYQAMKSEIMRYDRRAANPQNVLYKCNVHLREQASSRLRHKFKRGCKEVAGNVITKEEMLNKDFIAVSQKKGFSIPCLMPNSAEYWKGRGHDLFAMVRQLKRPHLFLTLSFAEYHCPILINLLKRLHDSNLDGVNVSSCGEQQESGLESVELDVSSEKKLQLIRDDPIVCATYFREMVLLLKKYLRRAINGPMGEYFMTDWFFRIEFQQRGSPHVHCLLWINNGVSDPLKDKEAAIKLIDSLITCDSSNPLAVKNIHRHTHTCFKNKRVKKKFGNNLLSVHECHKYCRFGAPFWPTNNTRILQPLYEEEDERHLNSSDKMSWKDYIEFLKTLRLKLKDILAFEDCPDNLDEIWALAGCDNDEMYELAIRTGLVRPTVLYKRKVADRWTNPHLKWNLAAFIGNGDCQFILDYFSLVRYCVSYVTKGEKSHSQLYSEIMKLRAEHNFDDRTLLKMLCSKSLRAKETSAQEAAWILLNFPLSEASRMCVFIDTSLPSERCRSPKNKKALLALPEGSTDLWYLDVFDLYTDRPEVLKNICLAEFVAYYHQSKNYKRRNHARIIRYRKFKENSDDVEEKENFYRSMCTLYLPWENEVHDILSYAANDKSFVDLYNANEQVILSNRVKFDPLIGVENVLEEELQTCVGEEEENEENDIERRSVIGGKFKLIFDDEVEVAEYMNSDEQNVDIDLSNCGLDQSFEVVEVKRRGVWKRDEFLSNIRILNAVQREIVLSVIHGIRLGSVPCLIYVDGAAGTGKSVVARNIANAFETFSPGNNNEDSRVIITAFTGKAAYNIGGVTMHQAYKLSLNQEVRASERLKAGNSKIMNPLQHEALANLQNYFSNVHGQIIDEISLVSDRNFLAVDQRCKEAKRNNLDFGNLWTIVFGDFRQLPPIGGKPVYASSTDGIAGSDWLWQKFSYVELNQNMRQGDDKLFAEILSKIGNGESLDEHSLDLIESRFVAENSLKVPSDAVRLFYRNKDKDAYNEKTLLANCKGKIIYSFCRDRIMVKHSVKGMILGNLKKREECDDILLERAQKLLTNKAGGLPYVLLLAINERYKLTVNQCTEDGLVNGAVGILKFVEVGYVTAKSGEKQIEVRRLWLKFPGNVGKLSSSKSKMLLRKAIDFQKGLSADLVQSLDFSLTPIPNVTELVDLVPIVRSDLVLKRLRTESWRYVVRQQFPLVSALADTIHSSQGSTYDKVCCEYNESMENSMVYVGMSRVRRLSSLYLLYTGRRNYRELKAVGKRLFVHPKTSKNFECLRIEKERLKSRPFISSWQHFVIRSTSCIRIVYHNVQSLVAHVEDVRLDDVFMKSDIILMSETWLRENSIVDLSIDMKLVARCDGNVNVRGGGVCIFSKYSVCRVTQIDNYCGIEVVCGIVFDDLFIAVMYCHNNVSFNHVTECVEILLNSSFCKRMIVCGDFNIDMTSIRGKNLANVFAKFGLVYTNQFNEPSTYGGTCIDAIFCTDEMILNQYQSYYSYHMPYIIDM